MFTFHAERVATLALDARLPALSIGQQHVNAGGLMSFGPSPPHLYRTSASYVDKILRGAKPGDLPIEQPSHFELAINLKTAKALRLSLPRSMLLRADHLIE